jgi:hypothetical protein
MRVFSIPRKALAAFIRLYQKTLSRDHGPLRVFYPHGYCRFYPTCSEYTRQAVLKHGALKGSALGARRISRCHPWSDGGVDKVPE